MLDETAALGRIEQLHDVGPPGFVSYVNPHTVNLAYGIPHSQRHSPAPTRAWRTALASESQRDDKGSAYRPFSTAATSTPRCCGAPRLGAGRSSCSEARAPWRNAPRARLSERIAGLRVVGTQHGFFADGDTDAVVDRVRACGATVLHGRARSAAPGTVARAPSATNRRARRSWRRWVPRLLGRRRATRTRMDEPRRPGMDLPARARAATPGPPIPGRQPGVPRSRTAPRRLPRQAGAHTDLSRVGMGLCGALVTTWCAALRAREGPRGYSLRRQRCDGPRTRRPATARGPTGAGGAGRPPRRPTRASGGTTRSASIRRSLHAAGKSFWTTAA